MPRRARLGDVLLVAAASLLLLLPTLAWSVVLGTPGALGTAGVVNAASGIIMTGALYWRQTHPAASAIAVYLGALSHLITGALWLPVDVLVLVALYSVTVHGATWASRAALGGAFIGAGLQAVANTAPRSVAELVSTIAFFVLVAGPSLAVWALGLARRSRLRHAASLAERAARLEVERDQQAQIAAAAERTRIAREMHDVVAHSLSVVIAQADGGRYAATTDAKAAERALGTIAETGRAALADMRRILGVLREPASTSNETPTSPQPIDTDLAELVAHVRDAGLAVSLVRMGTARPLPPGTGLALYRICQEALTNVMKHAGPAAQATVVLQWTPQRLVLRVEDDGRGAAATEASSGHGLVGMRERVDMFGGSLATGPRPGGGFQVRAEVPIPLAEEVPRYPGDSWRAAPPGPQPGTAAGEQGSVMPPSTALSNDTTWEGPR